MMTKTNGPNVSGWSLESGYSPKADRRKYPKSAIDSGQKNGLELILSAFDSDHDEKCFGTSPGFFIAFYLPGDKFPLAETLNLQLSEAYRISIESKVSDISDGLSKYKQDQRQCFFNDERKLRLHKTYTQTNCETECLVNLLKQECRCVPFNWPSMLFVIIIYNYYFCIWCR